MPTSSSAPRAASAARDLGHGGHVLARGQARDEVVELEHEADMIATEFRQLAVVGRVRSWPAYTTSPEVAVSSPPRMLSSVDLPLPEGPQQHDELAAIQVEVRCGPRRATHLDLAHAFR
jgi:hypothetical protein